MIFREQWLCKGGLYTVNRSLINKLFTTTTYKFSRLFCDCKVKLENEDFLSLFKLLSQKKQYKNLFNNRNFFPIKLKDIIQ